MDKSLPGQANSDELIDRPEEEPEPEQVTVEEDSDVLNAATVDEQRAEEERPVSCSGCLVGAASFAGLFLICGAFSAGEDFGLLLGGLLLFVALIVFFALRLSWDDLWPFSMIVRWFLPE